MLFFHIVFFLLGVSVFGQYDPELQCNLYVADNKGDAESEDGTCNM